MAHAKAYLAALEDAFDWRGAVLDFVLRRPRS
jgi:hypothetical protein